jgi:hypothetical protein
MTTGGERTNVMFTWLNGSGTRDPSPEAKVFCDLIFQALRWRLGLSLFLNNHFASDLFHLFCSGLGNYLALGSYFKLLRQATHRLHEHTRYFLCSKNTNDVKKCV